MISRNSGHAKGRSGGFSAAGNARGRCLRSAAAWFAALILSVPVSGAAVSDPAEARWYRGNTHAHSLNSDGDSLPAEVATWYRQHGYHFVFITDHEHVTDIAPLNDLVGADGRFLLLPGQEVTQHGADPERSSAHVNSLFATKLIWPIGERPCLGKGCGAVAPASMALAETLDRNIQAIRASGAIPQINHPNWRWSLRPSDVDGAPDFTLLEVWNGIDHVNNLGGVDDLGRIRVSAEGFWDHLLSRGKIVWAVASDDSHVFTDRPDPIGTRPGQAWIMVRAAELNSSAVRRALETGDFYASTGVAIDRIDSGPLALALTLAKDAKYPARYSTRFVGHGGRTLATMTGSSPRYAIHGREGYVRAVVTDSNGRQAWTQPVFTDERAARVRERHRAP